MTEFIPPKPEDLNTYFTQYEVESFIAQGGMGAVYLGKQLSLDRPVAVKILPTELGSNKTYLESFKSEAKSLACLNHSNLVSIIDFGEVEGMFFIIMEYVSGRSLYYVADGHSVNEKEAAFLVSEICKGLAHAHEHGILHRDIKPENILIDDEARPKLVDFGLAKPIESEANEELAFGTQGFMAPEMINDPHSVDHRADIYSIGILLYELLTAKLPENPYIPASAQNGTDKRFDEIIARAIQPDPAQRFASCSDMASELDSLLATWHEPDKDSITKGTKILATAASIGAPLNYGVNSSPATALLGHGPIATQTTALYPGHPALQKKKGYGMIVVAALLVVMIGIAGATLVFMRSDQTTLNSDYYEEVEIEESVVLDESTSEEDFAAYDAALAEELAKVKAKASKKHKKNKKQSAKLAKGKVVEKLKPLAKFT